MIQSGTMLRWLFVLAIAGCGPITYVNEVTRHAADQVGEARAAEADKYAPYYWTRAVEYYNKARELAAHADFQGANQFGRLASEAAEKAVSEAVEAKKDPSKRPLEEHPPKQPTAPAKDEEPPAPAKDKETAPSSDPATPTDKPKDKKKKPAPAKDGS